MIFVGETKNISHLKKDLIVLYIFNASFYSLKTRQIIVRSAGKLLAKDYRSYDYQYLTCRVLS